MRTPHHSPVRRLIRKELAEPVRRLRLDSKINKNPKQGSGMRHLPHLVIGSTAKTVVYRRLRQT